MAPDSSRFAPLRRGLVLAAALALVALVAAACTGSDSASEPATPPAEAEAAEPPAAQPEAPEPAPGEPPAPSASGSSSESVPVSFSRDIEPIVTGTCAQCHTGNGPGTQHVTMETAGDVADVADVAASLVSLRLMPPWPAAGTSVAFADDWSLSDDEIAALTQWAADGAPLDVDSEKAIVSTAGVFSLEAPDTVLGPSEGFDGGAGDDDQYRCFIYDPELTAEAWMQAYEFLPDQTAVVHHAIGYLVPGSVRERALARAAEDQAGGWECFGASGVGEDEIFLGWAPGQGPVRFPEGSGLRLEPGDFLIIQIHYHFDIDAPADFSGIAIDFAEPGQDLDEVIIEEFVAPAEIPCGPNESGPLCDRSAALTNAIQKYGREGVGANPILQACGGASSVDFVDGIPSARCDNPIATRGQIISVLGHEHELGHSFKLTLNPGTPDEQVLLDIPRWEFGWQFNYYPIDEIMVKPGDWVRIECSWDRTLRDPELEPAYVLWADGTDDEMCFGTMTVRELS